MSKGPKMLIEHGFAIGDLPHPFPDEPGMEYGGTIIPDGQKMNPNCVCTTRTCPLHGFCEYCVQHHREINRLLTCVGAEEHCHFHHCKQELLTERIGAEAATERAVAEARQTAAAGRAQREARGLPDYLAEGKEEEE